MDELLECLILSRQVDYEALCALYRRLHAEHADLVTKIAMGRAVSKLHYEIRDLNLELEAKRSARAKCAKQIGDAFEEMYEELYS